MRRWQRELDRADAARPATEESLVPKLQESINIALMRRLDVLEAEMEALQKKVKNLEHMVPA